MVVPIGSIINLSTKCVEYFELIDSVSADVKKLLHQSFLSAIANLKYAINAPTRDSAIGYLNQAKAEFIRAKSVEVDENLVSSYIGLAMCQLALGERVNAQDTVNDMKQIQLSKGRRNRAVVLDIIGGGIIDENPSFLLNGPLFWGVRGIVRAFGGKGTVEYLSERNFDEYKTKGLSFLGIL